MIKTLEFKGLEYKIEYVETYATHPTWYSFEDEKDVREAFWNIRPGDVVLDVGACCGSYTLTALACGAALVVAWAPGHLQEMTDEKTILEQNIRLNGWHTDRSPMGVVFDWGLYDRAGFLNPIDQTFESSEGSGKPYPWIGTLSLDLFTTVHTSEFQGRQMEDGNLLGGADWIKIDVEGAECEVLRGGIDFIRKHRPNVLVENHLFVRPTIQQEVEAIILGVEGYRLIGAMPHAASNVVHTLYSARE